MAQRERAREIWLAPREKATGSPATLADGRLLIHAGRALNPLVRPLVGAAEAVPAERILTLMHRDPAAALALAALRPEARVEFFHFDLYHTTQASRLASSNRLRLEAICAANAPPDPPHELALMMVRRDSEAALTLELARQAHAALAPGGKLLAAVDNPRDQWLRRQLERVFGNLTIAARDKASLVYLCKRNPGPPAPPEQLQYIRSHHIELGELALEIDSCYGVFSPTRFDEGSRALLEVMDTAPAGGAIFNPGCNWGGMGILAARRDGARRLLMVDANARSVQMAARNAERHMPGMAEVRHEFQGEHFLTEEEWGAFDVVVTNPPYATEFAVTAMFARVAQRALKPGGKLWMVGKRSPRMIELVGEVFGDVETRTRRGYLIAVAERR